MTKWTLSLAAMAALALPGLAVSAQGTAAGGQGGDVIASNTQGALDRPEDWDCAKIRPEFEDWLERGNPAKTWHYAGKTYRDVETGKLYNWQDWLSWARKAKCYPAGHLDPTRFYIGGSIVAGGAAAVLGSGGDAGPDSPG